MKKLGLLVLVVIAFAFALKKEAGAASTNGTATASVVAAIAIANVSDLAFGEGVQGDAAKVVAAGTSENADNGSFNVTGAPNRAYTITLPSSATLTTGGGGANETIAVTSFTSNPSATGTLNGSGADLLLVGATRAALPLTQAAGAYSGLYSVAVVY